MKFAIPEISWHNRDPVLSVDFQPKCENCGPLRLATGGTDTHVLIWYVSTTETGSVNLEVAADLTRHQKAVNVVRWAPNGQFLASGDDEAIIFVWKQKTDIETAPVDQGEDQYKETWVIHKTLRGHMEDVLDIAWSADSLFLASGSVDNKLLLWDVTKGKYSCILTDHKGFVQGVAWDPKGQIVATASSDRVFRTFDIATKKVTSRSSKAILPFPSDHPFHDVRVRLFHDDTLQTYYRRLQFSPDGLLVAIPAGRIEPEQGKLDMKPINAVYIYTRYSLKVPACILPVGEPALVTRWSPRLYRARVGNPSLAVPHRMILAIGTKRSVFLYDTHQRSPIAIISNIHYTRLTDLTWSADGQTLVASSTDGFCSVIMFAEDELGEAMPDAPVTTEPMEIQDDPQPETPQTKPDSPKKEPTVTTPKSTTPKIDKYMKFKAPEKSPKKQKIKTTTPKTPVKLDVLMDSAMPSWSDNSNNEIIKPDKMDVDKASEIIEIEDSEDLQLIYEDTQNNTLSPAEKSADKPVEEKKSPQKQKNRESPEKNVSPPRKNSTIQVNTPTSSKNDGDFLKQAKVTDVKEPAVKAVPSPKAPRRVNFVTLSSPKNKKKC